MSYRTTSLIAIFVFSILFSLLFSSSFFANQNAERTNQILASKRAELDIYRLRTPEDVCFRLDDQKLKEIDMGITLAYQNPAEGTDNTLSSAIKNSDNNAESDRQMEEQLKPPKEYFQMMGNRYTGNGLYFEEARAIMPLVRAYESVFNHTINNKLTRGYSDDIHQFGCNFSYNGNYYGLSIKFYSLRFLNVYSGFTTISIPEGRVLLDASSMSGTSPNVSHYIFRAIYPFNDTILWSNHSQNPVTLQLRYKTNNGSVADTAAAKSSNISQKDVTIYPNESHDEFLNNYYDSVDGIFNFTIKEFPAIRGRIVVDHYPVCSLDMEQIKSLYRHTLYPIKLPQQIPAGYNTTVCMLADRGEVQLFFWNKKLLTDKLGGESGGFQDPTSNVENGAIMIYEQFDRILYGAAFTPSNGTQRALELYDQISNATGSGISSLNGGPILIHIDSHNLAVGTGQITEERQREFADQYTSAGQHAPFIPVGPYYRPSRLVIFYSDGSEEPVSVSLVGKVPLDELVKLAKSLGENR